MYISVLLLLAFGVFLRISYPLLVLLVALRRIAIGT